MLKSQRKLHRSNRYCITKRVVALGCASGVLVSGPLGATPLSDSPVPQTFPVTPAVSKQPIPLTQFNVNLMPASEGLSVPELDNPTRAYSDLLWSKEDYLAWINGTGYQASTQTDTLDSVFPVSFVAQPVAPRAGAMEQWRLGARNWGYAADNGLAVRIGSDDVGPSVLANNATLGGVHIRQTAANTVIHYGLSDQLTLESGMQVAPDLVTTTLGGRYDTRQFGQLRAGVAHGSQADQQGWRYQAAYAVQLADDLHLSVRNEWDAPGFSDLGHYRGGVAPGMRRNWKATVPTQRWGDISGTYESFRPAAGTATERFGFSQQFWYSPNLRIGLQAQREVESGDYDIGIRFSVPIN